MTANDADVMHLRDGKVTEFWTSSTDPYAFDELIGSPGINLTGRSSAATTGLRSRRHL